MQPVLLAQNRHRLMIAVMACAISAGCRSYVETTPRRTLEGDDDANYSKVFGELRPADVTVINSVIVAYTTRPGVVTTDDFEFELLVPPGWMNRWGQNRGSSSSSGIFALALRGGDLRDFTARKTRQFGRGMRPSPSTPMSCTLTSQASATSTCS